MNILREPTIACIFNELEDFLKEIPPQAPQPGHITWRATATP